MTDEQQDSADRDEHAEHPQPTTNQPLNAPGPRPRWTPLLAVAGLILVIAVVFALITWLRYNT